MTKEELRAAVEGLMRRAAAHAGREGVTLTKHEVEILRFYNALDSFHTHDHRR